MFRRTVTYMCRTIQKFQIRVIWNYLLFPENRIQPQNMPKSVGLWQRHDDYWQYEYTGICHRQHLQKICPSTLRADEYRQIARR
jgi:hypothetical protein